MNRFFRWCMRHGAKFLFAFAVIQFFVGLIPFVIALFSETSHMAQHHGYSPDGDTGIPFGFQLQILFSSISSAVYPFFGALLVDRLDRWLSARDAEAGE